MSQPTLGAELLSQVFDSAPIEPSSADPQKESILVEITDASTAAENVSFILDACQSIFFNFLILFKFHPSSDFLPCQILPKETPMQEQESDSLLIKNNPAVADIQTIDSLVQHTTDGKKIICSAYFFAINMN